MTFKKIDLDRAKLNTYKVQKELWINHASGHFENISRYINNYEKGLLKKKDTDHFWDEIVNNCEFVKQLSENKDFFFYYNFHSLPQKRSVKNNFHYSKSPNPISLQTVFVSGFLTKKSKIKNIQGGFFVENEENIDLKNILPKLYPDKNFNFSFLFNLGYYYTDSLLNEISFGYNKIRSSLELNNEILKNKYLSFLGPSYWSEDNQKNVIPPLFNKSYIGFKNNGEIIFGDHWVLQDGKINIMGKEIVWGKKDINSLSHDSKKKKVIILTPFLNNAEFSRSKKWQNFHLFVGENRINFLILNKGNGFNPKPFLVKVKRGKILMPPIGFILSLEPKYAKEMFPEKISNKDFIKNGILDLEEEVTFDLDFPKGKDSFSFIYGGFLPLVLGGKSHTDKEKDLEKIMFKQGFFHPFSMQSQETPIDKPYAREPRAVFLNTIDSKGEKEYGYFSFSGRYEESIGVNLFEIKRILDSILGKSQRKILNLFLLDSGSAVKLIWVDNKMETRILNLTALGGRSYLGEYDKNVYNMISFKFN